MDSRKDNRPQIYIAEIPLAEMKAQARLRSASSKPPVGHNPARAFAFFPPNAKLEVVHSPKL